MIGGLLYLTTSQHDVFYSIGVCARYQASSKESHLNGIKKVFKYVCYTSEYGIYFSKDSNTYLFGYSDADWTRKCDDQKSSSGDCFYLRNNLVS
jgi:hypothetical protein